MNNIHWLQNGDFRKRLLCYANVGTTENRTTYFPSYNAQRHTYTPGKPTYESLIRDTP